MGRVRVTSDVYLHYQDFGAGRPVVLVHGGCMSHRVWESQICALVESGCRVVAPDLRGHGNSSKPFEPYTAAHFVEDLAALVDILNVDTFTLVGWSLGATIAATFADAYPERLDKLGLVSSSMFAGIAQVAAETDISRELPLEKMIANQRRGRPKGMERFVAGMFGSEVDKWMLRWLWSIGMQTPMWVATEILEIYADLDLHSLHRALSSLDVPGRIFHGVQDNAASLADAERIATEVLTDGELVAFEESGHIPFLEQSSRFDTHLVEFVKNR